MTLQDMLGELSRLSRMEKLHVMQYLLSALSIEEEALLRAGANYEVWSPYDAPEAAQTLLNMIEADRKSVHD